MYIYTGHNALHIGALYIGTLYIGPYTQPMGRGESGGGEGEERARVGFVSIYGIYHPISSYTFIYFYILSYVHK